MRTYLTFDIGTTALKTALVSDDGRLLALHVEEYALLTPQPGWAEMPPDTYWQAAVDGTRAVFASSCADPAALAAIGFSSQGQTFISLDAAGRPLANAIVWVDNRAQAVAHAWERDWLTREEFRQSSGYPQIPGDLTIFKLAWLAEHNPVAHAAAHFLCLPDYLIYQLTGEMATDPVMALFSGCYDLRSGGWSSRLLAAAGVTTAQLPVIVPSGTIVGRVIKDISDELGIPAGTPVCTGANDQIAGAIGAGNVHPGIVSETTGTALAIIATTDRLLVSDQFAVGGHAAEDACYALSYAVTSAIVLKWLRDLCAPGESYDAFLAGAGDIPPASDGLTVLPHFSGTGTPTFNPDARGAFVGLTLGHTRAHIARAIMEACACLLKECLDPIAAAGQAPTAIRSLGGAARSDLWLQMKADLLGLPVERPACTDAASLGAAVMAAKGAGQFNSIIEGSDAWYRPAHIFIPDPGRHTRYQKVYARYSELYKRLYGEGVPDVIPVP